MVVRITQETFNSAVKENIQDLDMPPEEALEEAIKQFEAQGVDLGNIVKELMTDPATSTSPVEIVEKLKNLSKNKAPAQQLSDQLELIKQECDSNLQNRVLIGKTGVYDDILHILQQYTDKTLQANCMKTLISLMTKQPDLLDDKGIDLIISNLKDTTVPYEVKRLTLRWTKECCVMHEHNRQKIYGSSIVEQIKHLLVDASSVDIIRDVLSVCRALVLDDDVRVEFGQAHEHARVIASETLCTMTELLGRFKNEQQLIHDLMLTITALMVRTEFCKKVEDAGCLQLIKEVMTNFSENEKINKQCFKLLKALAGNDDCKNQIIKNELAPVINNALHNNKDNAATACAGLACVAALSLRSPENSDVLYSVGLAGTIVIVMKTHADHKQIQKAGSWAIRNMVARNKYQANTFLDLGIEEILVANLKKFKEIEYDTKSALRDLGCKVQLKEEWTGKGGALTTGKFQKE